MTNVGLDIGHCLATRADARGGDATVVAGPVLLDPDLVAAVEGAGRGLRRDAVPTLPAPLRPAAGDEVVVTLPHQVLAPSEADPAAQVRLRQWLSTLLGTPVRRLISQPIAAAAYLRHTDPADHRGMLIASVSRARCDIALCDHVGGRLRVRNAVTVDMADELAGTLADAAALPPDTPDDTEGRDAVLVAAMKNEAFRGGTAFVIGHATVTAGEVCDVFDAVARDWAASTSDLLERAGWASRSSGRPIILLVTGGAALIPPALAALRRELASAADVSAQRDAAALGAALTAAGSAEPGDRLEYDVGLVTHRVVGGLLRPDRIPVADEYAVAVVPGARHHVCDASGSRLIVMSGRTSPRRPSLEIVLRGRRLPSFGATTAALPPGQYHVAVTCDAAGQFAVVFEHPDGQEAGMAPLPGPAPRVGAS